MAFKILFFLVILGFFLFMFCIIMESKAGIS